MPEQPTPRLTPVVLAATLASVVAFGAAVAIVASWLGSGAAWILVGVGVVMSIAIWVAGTSLGAVRRRAAAGERARIDRERA